LHGQLTILILLVKALDNISDQGLHGLC
jgi:hypothetical protein